MDSQQKVTPLRNQFQTDQNLNGRYRGPELQRPSTKKKRPKLTSRQHRELFELETFFPDRSERMIGIEVELPIFDSRSGLPVESVEPILKRLPQSVARKIHPELLKCTVEIVTDPHSTPADAAADFLESLSAITDACDRLNFEIRWQASFDFPIDISMINLSPRIQQIIDRAGTIDLNLHGTHSMHVHVGVDRGQAINVTNRMYAKMPHWVAQAANSPAMFGSVGDYQSNRAKTWGLDLPIRGYPRRFRNWADYYCLMERLLDTGLIECQKDVYLLARPSRFGTIECRGLDLPPSADHVTDLAEQIYVFSQDYQPPGNSVLPSLEVLEHEFLSACRLGNDYPTFANRTV